ncbi:UBIQUITIN-ACTIVATING ENZYME E1 2 [Salix koriyanagi]|uniref:UBIQUITIN-ACTIVATING ENZYME E1 2 n=1 Tax=Salix koriyanagi TaxID=2511006 RepID=A0A9Q0YU39_9ROSI|nr:UBIQUITIN-ACTIVATING ENZYME E1 2 [Salix koriyanagi]
MQSPSLLSRLKLEVFLAVFYNFGPEFTVFDVDGEKPHTGIVSSISNDSLALVLCVGDERLEFLYWDLVVFSRMKGITEVKDGKTRKIKNAKQYPFNLKDTTSFATYEIGGIVTQVKHPKVLNCKPLREATEDPIEFIWSDFSKFNCQPLLHLAFQALDKFVSGIGRFPVVGSKEDAQRTKTITALCLWSQGCIESYGSYVW